MQNDMLPSQEPQVMFPAAPQPRNFRVLAIVFGIALFFSCVTLTGVGIWAYQLNTKLTSTTAELTTLQGNYESLTAERDQLTSDLNTTSSTLDSTKTELDNTKAELEKTAANLANTQAELDSAKAEVSDLRTKMEKAAQYVDVLQGFFLTDSTFAQHGRRVDAVGDSELSDLMQELEDATSDAAWDAAWEDYVTYILDTLMDLLE